MYLGLIGKVKFPSCIISELGLIIHYAERQSFSKYLCLVMYVYTDQTSKITVLTQS